MTDWPQILKKHQAMVWRTAIRLLEHEADAADCFQETFLDALKIARREPVKNWPALLKTIATHRSLDRLRSRIRQRNSRQSLEDWDHVISNDLAPHQAVEAAELARSLRRGLAELPVDQARAFCLRFLEDLSYRQIAEQMDMSTSAVGVLIHRARNSLKTHLGSVVTEEKD